MGNVNAMSWGPGTLYVAVVGATEPASLIAAWDAAWVPLGYTFEGHAFTFTTETEDIEVAEELLPVATVDVKQTGTISFTLAEMTAKNLQRALNGGTIVDGGAYITFEPPLPGTTSSFFRAYGWQSDGGDERFVWRKCRNGGEVEIARRKGAEKAGIPYELALLSPGSSTPAFKWWGDSPDRDGVGS